MATGRRLTTTISGSLSCVYERTDNTIGAVTIKDVLNYAGLKDRLEDGVENDQADLLYHAVRQYYTAGGTENIDLDAADLQNIFGDDLRYEQIKCIIMKNREIAGSQKYLQVALQAEDFVLGPQGFRIIWEPDGLYDPGGSLGVAGILSLLSTDDISYDLIVIGNSALVNPISSGS